MLAQVYSRFVINGRGLEQLRRSSLSKPPPPRSRGSMNSAPGCAEPRSAFRTVRAATYSAVLSSNRPSAWRRRLPDILCLRTVDNRWAEFRKLSTCGGGRLKIKTHNPEVIERLGFVHIGNVKDDVSSRRATTLKRRGIRTRVQFGATRPSGYRTSSSDNVLNNRAI